MYYNPYYYSTPYYHQTPYHQNYVEDQNRQVDFKTLIGQFYTIPQEIDLGGGFKVPKETRVFIHNAYYNPSGEQIVTIVSPLFTGVKCMAFSKEIPSTQLLGIATITAN